MSSLAVKPRRQRLQRSELAVPATSERFFQKAADSAVDVVFLDLEDAVADERKDAAGDLAIGALNSIDWRDLANAVFSPTDEQLAWAAEIQQTLQASATAGAGAVGVKGVLIDLAHAKLARSLQERAALIAANASPARR